MKKLKVLGLAVIAAGMVSLSSCLDGGSNQQQFSTFALVDYSSTLRTLIYPMGFYPLYIPTITNDASYSAGDCIYTSIQVDMGSSENAAASTNGFYVASGAASSPLTTYSLDYSPSDSTALNGELLLSGAESGLLISPNYKKVVIVPTFTSAMTEQKNTYITSLDYNQEPETVNGTERVYTLCLRAQKREEGKAPTINNVSDPIALEGSSFYNLLKSKEQAAGKKLVSYRVKYPMTFNSDSTKIETWGYSQISQFSIEEATNN